MNQEQISVLRDLEASVLGGILVRNDTLALIPRLDPGDFFDPRHRHVFSAFRQLEAKGRPLDVVVVESELLAMGKLESVGGVAFLGELAAHVPTPENVVEYSRRVRDASLARRVAASLGEILTGWRENNTSGEDMLSATLEAVAHLDLDQPDETRLIGQLVRARFGELDQIAADRAAGKSALTGITTGVARLDERMGGYQPGIVTIVCGRPQHGKSSMALAGEFAASGAGHGVHQFTLEDSWRALADRAMARTSQVPGERIRSCTLQRSDLGNLQAAASKLWHRKNWLVDDRSGIDANEIVRSVRRHRKENETRIVFVDYVQLVRRPKGASENDALGEIMLAFQTAAKQDDLAYVVLSQLNRECEKRPDKRPQLSDLRGSGTIEEYCKAAIGVYRGAVYGGGPRVGIDYDDDEPPPSQEEWEATMQLIVLKNSQGATGRVLAKWDGPTFRVE